LRRKVKEYYEKEVKESTLPQEMPNLRSHSIHMPTLKEKENRSSAFEFTEYEVLLKFVSP
jgi:hypothetical protein